MIKEVSEFVRKVGTGTYVIISIAFGLALLLGFFDGSFWGFFLMLWVALLLLLPGVPQLGRVLGVMLLVIGVGYVFRPDTTGAFFRVNSFEDEDSATALLCQHYDKLSAAEQAKCDSVKPPVQSAGGMLVRWVTCADNCTNSSPFAWPWKEVNALQMDEKIWHYTYSTNDGHTVVRRWDRDKSLEGFWKKLDGDDVVSSGRFTFQKVGPDRFVGGSQEDGEDIVQTFYLMKVTHHQDRW